MPTKEQILEQYWGYASFKGEQAAIVESILSQKDTVALLPTGGGKSICFQVPALMQEGVCLVISPLIALMKDQVENLQKRNIPAIALVSGMSYYDLTKALKKVVQEEYKFLYLSPERLESTLFKDYLPQINVSMIAIDEAHCISQWGYDFRPAYLKIAALRAALPNTTFVALTASATPLVQKDIVEKLQLKEPNIFQQSFEKPNLSYSVFKVDSSINKAIQVLKNVAGSSIVYCSNRKETKRIALLLQQHGFSADFYHAGLTQVERSAKQKAWIENTIRVIVCTNAFGMGIDKPDVRTVIHLSLPDCIENYYQEAGRAGRDGKKAYAVLLHEPTDIATLQLLPQTKFPSFDIIKQVYQALADYLQIPVGIGEGKYYDFNLIEFCTNFKLDFHLVINVLKILEQQGHLAFSENIFLPSQVEFTTDKYTINNVEKVYPHLDTTMKALLRTYEGVFEHRVSINEKLLAKVAKLPFDKIYADLKILHGYGIIEYLPQKETPQIFLLTNRAPAQHLQLNAEIYFQRKKLYEEKVQAMVNYIQLTDACRSQHISAYFGDALVKPCGVCDNCLAKKSNELSKEEFILIQDKIMAAITHDGIKTQDLFQQLNGVKKQKLQNVLEFLLSEKYLRLDDFGFLHKIL
ncbi:MAG: RecQ family ATP-dependent DNA helicase [Chitinophagaceae bacterium]|jgi:ATP-dependent DNA helicase RecQ|nr:RecQ family ATP-dependent DNA helicase [Chitinophagaceae bacterium]